MFSRYSDVTIEMCRERYNDLLREAQQQRILGQVWLSRPKPYQQWLGSLGELLMICGWWLKERSGTARLAPSEQVYILRQPRI